MLLSVSLCSVCDDVDRSISDIEKRLYVTNHCPDHTYYDVETLEKQLSQLQILRKQCNHSKSRRDLFLWPLTFLDSIPPDLTLQQASELEYSLSSLGKRIIFAGRLRVKWTY